MPIPRWKTTSKTTRQEDLLLRRLDKKRKLFGFLRRHREELFDEAFQVELESMYRDTGAGKEAVPPALLALVVLLQGYQGIFDAELRRSRDLTRVCSREWAHHSGMLVTAG